MHTLQQKKPKAWTIGFAMFSMFFGAGNIIFPLALGAFAQDQHPFAIFGLIITAVIVPFSGLMTMILFDGNYMQFFNRIGKTAGFTLALLILAILGPLGALPRCITTSYATIHLLVPSLPLPLFSLISCLLIYFLTFKSRNVLQLLGSILTPLLLLSLLFIIIKGLLISEPAPESFLSSWHIFLQGALSGYNTMDLIAAFFFSSVVIVALYKDESHKLHGKKDHKLLFKASLIGAILLAIIYIGFTSLSANFATLLSGVSQDELLGKIAFHLLGPYAALVVSIAVFFACLTTEIALALVFAEFAHLYLANGKLNYKASLVATLVVSFLISTLSFEGISKFLGPLLQVTYPSLIVLTFCNLCYKLFKFKHVKIPVGLTFLITLFIYFYA